MVVDVLSTDAVKIRPGAMIRLDMGAESGAEEELLAEVRVIEPSGFTKASPLGIEEQRVNVVADLIDPPGRLSDRCHTQEG